MSGMIAQRVCFSCLHSLHLAFTPSHRVMAIADSSLSGTLTPVHLEPAINREALARHVIGIFRGKVEGQSSDLPRFSWPVPGNVRQLLVHLCRILRALCRHWRADEAGRDRVDIDPQRREFERQRPGEGQETALGGAICCAARAWDRLVHRGDVDDLAAARGLSPTDEFAAAEKRAVKIGVDYPVEFLGCHFGDACAAAPYAG